ncbi:MAG TPA: DUF1702 family protein [Streptosporangiaceae bacterium]
MNATLMGRLRLGLFLPDASETTFAKRGFYPADRARQENLEKIGGKFLEGFACGMAGRTVGGIESALEEIELPFRGFAYEGCGMALGIRDGIRPAGRHWVSDFVAGRAASHIYMAYIGVGWAMARLPRMCWRPITPPDRLLRWLVLDGYGFHQAYFHTSRYVTGQYQGRVPLSWLGPYANRAADQGIGRALWFVNGADVERTAAAIAGFAPGRRGDLWSGAGLASVYAGGVDEAGLARLAELAGEHRADAAQGAAFAAQARLLAGLATGHTETGARVLCGMPVEKAAAVTEEERDGLPDTDGPVPGYEVWRQRIRNRFA